jgi:hypothetical protein
MSSITAQTTTSPSSFRADDQRVFLRASKPLHHVLARQRLPHRTKRFLIHQSHRTPARGVLRAPAAVVRPFARTRVPRIAGVQRAIRAADDVDEVHAPIVAGSALPRDARPRIRTSPDQARSAQRGNVDGPRAWPPRYWSTNLAEQPDGQSHRQPWLHGLLDLCVPVGLRFDTDDTHSRTIRGHYRRARGTGQVSILGGNER